LFRGSLFYFVGESRKKGNFIYLYFIVALYLAMMENFSFPTLELGLNETMLGKL
jgi:hypothetical protein